MMRDLDRQVTVGDGHIDPPPWQGHLAHSGLPHTDGARQGQKHEAKSGCLVRPRQNGDRMGRPTLLHDDWNQPRVSGSRSGQAGENARPQPRHQIADIRFNQYIRILQLDTATPETYTHAIDDALPTYGPA